MKKAIRNFLIALFVVAIAIIAVSPWALYEWTLFNMDGFPDAPAKITISDIDKATIWAELREKGPIQVEALTPYSYLGCIFSERGFPAGTRLAWYVARDHNAGMMKDKKMNRWHLNGAALTIWLTRNWTTDQLLEKANEIRTTGKLTQKGAEE